MGTSMRLTLLGVGCIVLLGIFWDLYRASRQKKNSTVNMKRSHVTHVSQNLPIAAESDVDLSDFEEVVLVKSVKRIEAPVVPVSEKASSMDTNDIIALSIMARQPGMFLGKKLQDAFVEAQLEFGDMDIFHRYDNRADGKEPIFSVASAVEPGVFDLVHMDTMTTPGLMLFFKLSTPNQSIAAFELMLRIARQLAQRLDGELRDDRRRLLTIQSIEQYREKVRMVGLRRHVS